MRQNPDEEQFIQPKKAHGSWTEEEKQFNINHLELFTVFFGLNCFASESEYC